jgi:hypothetical protein
MPKAVPLQISMSTRSCAYPNVNANWLLTGEGEMLFNENEVQELDGRRWSTSLVQMLIKLLNINNLNRNLFCKNNVSYCCF